MASVVRKLKMSQDRCRSSVCARRCGEKMVGSRPPQLPPSDAAVAMSWYRTTIELLLLLVVPPYSEALSEAA